jgi:hypothetical protein
VREMKRQGCDSKYDLYSVEYIEVSCETTKLFYEVDVYF